jgi:hypothetical protein
MKVLRATEEQYLELNGYSNKTSKLIFVKDGGNNWIVGLEVINDYIYNDIKSKLEELEIIDYTEIPE